MRTINTVATECGNKPVPISAQTATLWPWATVTRVIAVAVATHIVHAARVPTVTVELVATRTPARTQVAGVAATVA